MPNLILYGGAASADAYQYRVDQTDDDGTPVLLRSTTAIWAPNGWYGEAVIRTCMVVVSSNVGAPMLLTPLLDGVPLDGTNGNPDCRVTFDIPTPAAGERSTVRIPLGLFRPIRIEGGATLGSMGLRATWFQFQLDSTGALVVPSGETNPDLRFEGVELDPQALRPTAQVVNSG